MSLAALIVGQVDSSQLGTTFCNHLPGINCSNCYGWGNPYIWPQWVPQPIVITNPPIVIEHTPAKVKRGQVFEDEAGKLHIFDGKKWITIDQESSSENEPEAVSSV